MRGDEEMELEKKSKIPELELKENFLGKWSSFFIDRKRVTFLLIISILAWGILAYRDMPQEVNPEVTIPMVAIQTIYPGASPDEVESLVTDKIENKISSVDAVKTIKSTSGLGYSMITVEFDDAESLDEHYSNLKDQVSQAETEIPSDAETPVVQDFKTSDTPMMIANIYGDYDRVTLKIFAEKCKDELEKMKGISSVRVDGGIEREIQVMVNPQKLGQYGISVEQIAKAIEFSNVNFPGGNVVLDDQNLNIRTVGEFREVDEIRNTMVSMINSRPLFVRDLAEVIDGIAKQESISKLTTGIGTKEFQVQDSISLTIYKKNDGSIIKISEMIRDFFEKEQGNLFPEGLNVAISGDMANMVREELGNVMSNATSGLFLVIIVLFLFIGIKESLIVAFIIPTSIFTAFGLMNAVDITLNRVSLFALILAVGLMVDNGIIVMENIHRLKSKGLNRLVAAKVATNQIAPAIGASTLTTVAAFFPIILTTGILGDYITQLPLTVIFALVASFVVAISITPTLSALFLSSDKRIESTQRKKRMKKWVAVLVVFILGVASFKTEDHLLKGFTFLSVFAGSVFALMMYMKQFKSKQSGHGRGIYVYVRFLEWLIHSYRRMFVVILSMVALLILSVTFVQVGFLDIVMFTNSDQTRMYVNIESAKGSTLKDTEQLTQEVEEILYQYDEIDNFVSNIGAMGADNSKQPGLEISSNTNSPHIARIVIELKKEKDREKKSYELAKDIREDLQSIARGKIELEEITNGPPSSSPVQIRLTGENLEDLKRVAMQFKRILDHTPGVIDPRSGVEKGMPELRVQVKKDKVAAFGLTEFQVALAIRNAINGVKATVFRQNQDEVDVVIRTQHQNLDDLEDLKKLNFFTQMGHRVPFQEVADFYKAESLNRILHVDSKRAITVSAQIEDGYNAMDILNQVKKVSQENWIPDQVNVVYGGEVEDIEESFLNMYSNMLIAIVLVFLILSIQFNSLSQPIIILMTVPFASIGVINGLILTGYSFGFISFVGFVGLIGIAVNDAIVFIDYLNYLKKLGYDTKSAIKETGMTRFVPVVATTITTAGGILPVTLKDQFLGSMGYTLIFGLLVTSFLTLVMIPIFYRLIEDAKLFSRKIFQKWFRRTPSFRL
jgi:HAE1 family hydrophobic/amphiphilic exporter-1